MSARSSNFFDELVAAGQGTVRILVGRRDAGSFFALNLRGLVGSLIALLAAITLNLVLSALVIGDETETLSSFQTLMGNIALYAMQIAASWVVLRHLGKREFFVPYVTVDNWTTFFLSIALAVLGLLGLGGEFGLVLAGLVTLLVKVNIARIIIGLPALHIVLLIVAQTIGGFIGLLIVGGMLGPMPTLA